MSNNKSKKIVNNKLIIFGVLIVLLILVIIGLFAIRKNSSSNSLTPTVENTSIEKSKSYKLDLRIYGTYNDKSVNKIIMVTNYENTDKEIMIIDNSKEENYIVKDNNKYKLEDEKLTEVDSVLYENTSVYLDGVNKMKDLKQTEDESIGKETFKVYKGVISSKDVSDILKEANLDIKVDKDIETEVWLTSDDYVYKVYYKLDNLTIYASYFGYGKMNKVNLEMYK